MPRSKHKNGKLNSKLKRSKKPRASKLKLRNKSGGASGSKIPDRRLSRFGSNRISSIIKRRNRVVPFSRSSSHAKPIKPASPANAASPRSRSPSPPPPRRRSSRRPPSSPRRSSSSSNSNSSSNNARRRKLFNEVMSGIPLEIIMKTLNESEIGSLSQVDKERFAVVKELMEHKGYTFLFEIYNDTEFKKVIKKIEQIDLTDTKNDYLQTHDKLKEIQEVYKKKSIGKERKRINKLIKIYYKYFNKYKMEKKEDPTLYNYIKYLKQTSKKQFGKYDEDIERGLAILTLFYGFSDIDIKSILISGIKNPEIFLDYISLLNQLFLNQGDITFRSNLGFEFTVRAVQISKKFNKSGIDKYVELRKDGKKDHNQAVSELEGNPKFLR